MFVWTLCIVQQIIEQNHSIEPRRRKIQKVWEFTWNTFGIVPIICGLNIWVAKDLFIDNRTDLFDFKNIFQMCHPICLFSSISASKPNKSWLHAKNYKIINGENDDEIDVCVCEYDDENSPPSPRTPLVPLLNWEHSSGMNSDRLELFHPHYCWMELYSNNPEWDLASSDPQNSCRPNDPILHTIGIRTYDPLFIL